MKPEYGLLLVFFMAWVNCLPALALDPVEELKSFSDFHDVDVQKLAEGEILVERGDITDFPRGISAQACYLVMAPPEKAARIFQKWDASRHQELKLYSHCPLHSPPTDDDFERLDLSPQESPFRWLVDKTESTNASRFDLHLSIAEAVQVFEAMKKDGRNVQTTVRIWKDLLKARALKFQNEGMSGMPSYEMGGSIIQPSSEIQNLLKEVPKISAQFSPFLAENLLATQSFPSGNNPPDYYWELLEIDRHAAFNLGAIFFKKLDEGRFQMVDCTYYSSSGIYTSFTLRQFWPVRIKDREASLVWRGEFVSAPLLAAMAGMERMAASGIMAQEIKKEIRFFQEDAAKAP